MRTLLSFAILFIVSSALSAAPAPPFWQALRVTGPPLKCLRGIDEEKVVLLSCAATCRPIPWQLDELDSGGRLVLDQGPQPNSDDPPRLIDENDEIWWMAEDVGRRMRKNEIPPSADCVVEFHVRVRRAGWEGRVYAVGLRDLAPRSPTSYVRYDPDADLIAGARVSLGFSGPTPQHLLLHDGGRRPALNLLDRLKVRASAWFLGLIPMSRDEGDLSTEFVAWRAGPIRVVRRQRQWIRLGWGIRSPTFGSDTYFYRDFAELPVRLRLNFPPTYFFSRIKVEAILDFRDLTGWKLVAPGLAEPLKVGTLQRVNEKLNGLPADWFALMGSDIILVQVLGTSASLATVERRLLYREHNQSHPPEAIAGERPGVGYRLTRWGDVGSGVHWFSSTSYALPVGYDLARFLREREHQPSARTKQLCHPCPEP
jgi:hypothetical protein